MKAPTLWKKAYLDADFKVISKDNFMEFLI